METAREFIDEKVFEKQTKSLLGYSIAADFMEEYAEKIATKFAEWITFSGYEYHEDKKIWVLWHSVLNKATTEQLYKLFQEDES